MEVTSAAVLQTQSVDVSTVSTPTPTWPAAGFAQLSATTLLAPV
jgi:hypothetical protein